ncbi:signal transduction protein [Hahella sp. CCB-MM4]|nr:signal transduction protein [Hahella sp. CCB-MM4]
MEAVGHGLYAGFLLFVIIFNFFIFIALRESMYFHYMLLTSMILLIQASLSGRTFQLIWPDLPDLQNLSILIAVPLSAFALTEFSRRFLETRLYAPRANRLLKSISFISLACLALAFFLPPYISKQLSVIGALTAVLAVSIVSPYLWYKGIRQARLFSCAWTGLQIGALTTLLFNLGVIPHSLLTVNALEIGSALQAALISLAIVERVYQERDHRLKVQQQVIEEQRELQRMEQRNLYDATHHPVTELPNRGYLERFIKERIGVVGNKSLSLCLISLNRYREIDRTMGQDNADQLLYQIAHQLNDFVSPLPGVTALETIAGTRIHVASVDDITLALVFDSVSPKEQEVLMMAISGYLLQRIDFGNLSLDLDPRFGLARYPEHGQNPQSLLRMAKIALDATHHIQGCVAEYCDDFNPYSERRLTLMAELAKAIENNNLVLNFQPQLSLKTGKITSFEGLVRWHHDRFGHVSPEEFIYLAEESGIIHQLTLWVMENALGKLQALQTSGYGEVGIAINISAVDLEMPHFVEEVKELLSSHEVNPRQLTLELTETALMRTPDLALETLKQLSDLGFSIALDDFGAGYSSLSYIQRLPLHKIKIDRSLVHNIERCQENYVIAKTAIEMSHGLGYEVVMEGVEELATLEVLKVLGADQIQGFWLARPMLWDFAQEWLRTFVADGIRLPEPSTAHRVSVKSTDSATNPSS